MPHAGTRFPFALMVSIVALLATTLAFSQVAATGIAGVVKDPSDAVISGASVKIYNAATDVLERQMNTGNNGEFVATLLRPGTYRIAISAQGFKNYESTVEVRIGETVKNVAKLKIGTGKESVNVEATPSLVNTESATMGQPVDSAMLSSLPTPVPNYFYLLTLSTGTTGEPGDPRQGNRGNVDITVNGQRTTNNNASLEGININDFNLAHFDTIPLPNPNAIQEFRVATSLYDATTGSKGGGNVNTLLRTGTKDWHWAAYWQHRNDALNAREWFFNRDNPGARKQKALQNVLGFSLGGPVPIPVLKGFFFANAQGVRFRNGIDPVNAVASAQGLPALPASALNADGTTSAALLAPLLPPGFTAANIDPVALNFLNLKSNFYGGTFYYPRSGQQGCSIRSASALARGVTSSLNCTFAKVVPGTDMQYTLTWDRPLRGGKDSLALRGFNDNGQANAPFGAGGTLAEPLVNKQRNRFASISHTLQISNRQLNEFRFGYSRFNSSFIPTDIIQLSDIGATRPNSATVPGVYFVSVPSSSPFLSFGTGVNDERGTVQNSFTWTDTWSLVTGRHTLRAGAEINRFQINRFNNFAVRGSIGFDQIGTGTGCGVTIGTCILPFQGFLMGMITNFQSAAGISNRWFRDTDLAAFFQDDFRISPRLTINLGIRWEGLGFANDLFNRLSNYYPDRALAGKNPFVFAKDTNIGGFNPSALGLATVDDCLVDHCRQNKNFAPRVGFAWDVNGNHKTVVRGGYGIYYQRLSNQTSLQTNLGPPFNFQPIVSNPNGTPAQNLANPFPSLPIPALVSLTIIPQNSIFTGLRFVSTPSAANGCPAVLDINNPCVGPVFKNEAGQICSGFGGTAGNCSINFAGFTAPVRNLKTPYNQQWNLTVQREISGGWAVELGYVGAHYLRGIGIYNPFMQLAAPTPTTIAPGVVAAPVTVKDSSGNSYTITTNTLNNVALRSGVPGMSPALGMRFSGNIGFVLYHSMQATVSHRFQHGLYMQAAYTWAHTIDNVSGSLGTDELNVTRSGEGGANLLDYATINPALARANGDFDRRHRLAISYSYDLPVPKSGIWGTQAFQGWSISGITYYQNGLPFTPVASSAGALGSRGIATPLFTCSTTEQAYTSGSIQSRVNQFINPACFTNTVNAPFSAVLTGGTDRTYGNSPRNAWHGPFQQDFDFSVAKRFRIVGERHTISFRTDFFNMFNHPVFRAPNTVNITSPNNFGQITQTVIPSRLIQFNLKYEH
jgi:carboxypeptidase family protein